jgi:hypothetical protein
MEEDRELYELQAVGVAVQALLTHEETEAPTPAVQYSEGAGHAAEAEFHAEDRQDC